jgi:hypothetical protein
MFKFKSNVPALGDNLDARTLYPIQKPLVDEAYKEEVNQDPEKSKLSCELRKEILKVTGARHLRELDRRSDDREFVEEVNERILFSRKALGKNLPLETRAEKAEKYGKTIDKLINGLVKKFFPGHTKALGPRNEIMATHNWGKLLLVAFDSSWNDKVRYEAKRKLSLMDHFSKVDYSLGKRKRHLEFLADVMEERVFDPNGEKRGGTKTQWLVTKHDLEDDNRCVSYEFIDSPPKILAENELIEQIDFRTISVALPNGERQRINFMIDIGEKDDESIYLKSLRHPERELDDLLRDLNRGRLLFRNKDESKLVISEIQRRLRQSDPKTGKGHKVSVEKEKELVGGDGGKPTIPCYKFNLVIDGKDFEFQSFLPKDYRDYFCWKPAAWCKHEVDRFFDNNLCETLWPEAHYPGLDRKQLAKEAFEREYEKEWSSRRILPVTDHGSAREFSAHRTNGNGQSMEMPESLAT